MPIGKNAIKRVENNGYTNVKTDAPDMMNSTVLGAPSSEVMEMVAKTVEKKSAPKKATAKKPCAKKSCVKNDGFKRVELGETLPIHLL